MFDIILRSNKILNSYREVLYRGKAFCNKGNFAPNKTKTQSETSDKERMSIYHSNIILLILKVT